MIKITIDDVLGHLVARTNAQSSMGAQLDQLSVTSEARAHGPGWRTHAKPAVKTAKDPEAGILRDSALYRCVTGLGNVKGVDIDAAGRLVDVAVDRGTWIGNVIVNTLRAFQSALASVTDEDLERAERRASKAPPAKQEEVRQKALGEYRAPRGLDAVMRTWSLKTSAEAAELYADCLLVLALYVQDFNRRKAA